MTEYIKRYWQWIGMLALAIYVHISFPDFEVFKFIGLYLLIFILWYRLTIESIKLFSENKAIKRIFAGDDMTYSINERMGKSKFLASFPLSNAILLGMCVLGMYFKYL